MTNCNKCSNILILKQVNIKKEFFDVVKKKTEQILCSDCIQTCIFKNRLWEEFEKKIETNDYIDINNFFIDMH